MKNYAIILASGKGSRFGSDIPKQFMEINDKTIFEYSIEAFENAPLIDEIIVVITPEYRSIGEKIITKNNYKKISLLLDGGKLRKDSSYIGVNAILDNEAKVLIHDCARPFVSAKIIEECITKLDEYDAVCTAVPSTDTILSVKDDVIENIPERKNVMRAQTPQGFKLSLIKKAHGIAKNDENFTDDCGLVVRYNLSPVGIVEGSEKNIKITYPEDIYVAQKYLSE